jgi:hypothetical protein
LEVAALAGQGRQMNIDLVTPDKIPSFDLAFAKINAA